MEAGAPSFLLREARPQDHRELLRLARELDSVNLPTDGAKLRETLERSAQSFRGRTRERVRALYIFCAEEIATNRIVAASMIIGKHGTPEAPHYYLEINSDDRYSHTLRKSFHHPYLQLCYSMDGPTELGGLIATRAMRNHPERVGKQISWVRFLYMGRHLKRFEPEVLAEMLAPMLPGHGNVFWDHYGRRMTGLSFQEADLLSTRDKEFIRALFPETPLYTFMLPDHVTKALGAVGEETRGAVRLLEQAGMKYLEQIDPFDGGPYYGGSVAELAPIRQRRVVTAIARESAPERQAAFLIALENGEGFRAVRADGELRDNAQVIVAARALEALGAASRARVDLVPLP
jgi:arginine N-succinyltransferase